jgi:hypothetical protein
MNDFYKVTSIERRSKIGSLTSNLSVSLMNFCNNSELY